MSTRKRQPPPSQTPAEDSWLEETQQLTFAQSRTALELTLAALQSEDLEVETMAGLYKRAVAYADRCEEVLQQVQQQVEELDLNALEPEA
ncbi:exodeoxyribonuclease VII small subunit [Synechococcus sp. CBW1107]|uniref:exodeoxyribonuclease VII small subunit n=1 Tax=Synechococcus sp. CBW1107 TaxID=2789857 RepID=UPI0018CCCC75|nr:exodeoxyribonuclease VII small subunit [Synechococcus sp. CBW1107]QPN57497.1 exodeoxyribonuclease VII small subunit [Synechococcus sp. CBW1107]CAK6701489.1 Exodeoxyribonuclease 7 small subunit [Synechococcus sp. CBW1107]